MEILLVRMLFINASNAHKHHKHSANPPWN